MIIQAQPFGKGLIKASIVATQLELRFPLHATHKVSGPRPFHILRKTSKERQTLSDTQQDVLWGVRCELIVLTFDTRDRNAALSRSMK